MSIYNVTKNEDKSVTCRAFRHRFDRNVYQEKRNDRQVWVAYFQCQDCDTVRVDTMQPDTCQLLHRSYSYDEQYDTKMDPQDAKRIIFKKLVENGKTR